LLVTTKASRSIRASVDVHPGGLFGGSFKGRTNYSLAPATYFCWSGAVNRERTREKPSNVNRE